MLIVHCGDAAALAFNGAITPHAEQFGMTIMNLGSMAQMTGAIGRSMSPVAGAAIICAQLAGVNPFFSKSFPVSDDPHGDQNDQSL